VEARGARGEGAGTDGAGADGGQAASASKDGGEVAVARGDFVAALREAVGSDALPRAYLAVERAEAVRFAGAGLADEVAALRGRILTLALL
jgi:hypothetical protein